MNKPTINRHLIKQAVVAAQSNRRQATSHTKTRGEVTGGGRKPWKQKGTGRARAGSNRSPIWIGGGITFGPQKERNYKVAFPQKMAKQALAELLRLAQSEDRLQIVDSLSVAEPKTKQAVALLHKHHVLGKSVLLITKNLEAELVVACRNIPNVNVTMNHQLSILDLTSSAKILIDKASASERQLIKEEPKTTKKVATK